MLQIRKPAFLMKYYNHDFLMPTTRKQKKTRMSRGLEMLSDIENVEIMLAGNPFEREESEDSSLARRSESFSCNASENNDENLYSNPRENRSSNSSAAKIPRVLPLVLNSINSQVNITGGSQEIWMR